VSRKAIVLIAALAGAVLSGCAGGQSTADQSSDTRYVAGDGRVQLFEPAARRQAPAIEGETLEGDRVALADHKGKVVVLNFWASWCAPCRSEAPTLKDVAERTKDRGVTFLGVDFKDRKADALAFQRRFELGYPSIFDQPGKVALAFNGTVPPAAIPTTLVIDRQGRIAARALGEVKHSALLDVVTKISGEGSGGG